MNDKQNQQSKLRKKDGFEMNDDSRWTFNTNNQIKLKTSTLKE